MNVIDGGIFLHKIVWDKRRTFQQIAANSCEYEIKQFFENCVIVFDSYHEQATIKDPVFAYSFEGAGIELSIKLVHNLGSI